MWTPTTATQEIHNFIGSLSATGGKVGAIRIGQRARREGEATSHFALTLDKNDFAALMKRLEAYKHIPEAGRWAMLNVQSYIQNDVLLSRFETEGKGSGKGWKPLKPSTRKWRKRVGVDPEHPILQVGGFYKDALLSDGLWKDSKIGPYARLEFDPSKLSVIPAKYDNVNSLKASPQIKFFVHQLGVPSMNIDARRVFPTYASDFTNAQKIKIKHRIEEGILDYLGSEYHAARVERRKMRRIRRY